MTTNTILLRNTISRVTSAFEETQAKLLLADPHYAKILEIVESDKPEVLGQSTIDGQPIDDEGNPVVEPAAKTEKGKD